MCSCTFYGAWLTVTRPELFDEYTRRQYVAKAPDRNPFSVEEEPAKFTEFDVFTKVLLTTRTSEVKVLTRTTLDSSIATTYAMDLGEPRSHPRQDGGTKG
jgi:hypothetical protein